MPEVWRGVWRERTARTAEHFLNLAAEIDQDDRLPCRLPEKSRFGKFRSQKGHGPGKLYPVFRELSLQPNLTALSHSEALAPLPTIAFGVKTGYHQSGSRLA